ncbi:MAG: hypothetical protein E6I90_12400, partial [Chloroflexi bacterium]
MESLNDIINRTAAQRQQTQDQRSTQQDIGTQAQRPGQPYARRPPLPEQTARLGQPGSPINPELPPSRAYPQQTVYGGMAKPGQRQVSKFPPQRTSNQPLRRSDSDTRSSYTRPNQPPEDSGLPTDRSEFRSPSDPYPREAALPMVDRDFYETYPAPP